VTPIRAIGAGHATGVDTGTATAVAGRWTVRFTDGRPAPRYTDRPAARSLPMVALFLWSNAAIYAVFALWCALRPDSTAHNLGFTALSESGRSEYFTIYGGLQWGLALLFAYLASKPELQRAGIVVGIALYAPLVLHRTISLFRYGPVETLTKGIAGLEWLMLAAALLLWFGGAARTAQAG